MEHLGDGYSSGRGKRSGEALRAPAEEMDYLARCIGGTLRPLSHAERSLWALLQCAVAVQSIFANVPERNPRGMRPLGREEPTSLFLYAFIMIDFVTKHTPNAHARRTLRGRENRFPTERNCNSSSLGSECSLSCTYHLFLQLVR